MSTSTSVPLARTRQRRRGAPHRDVGDEADANLGQRQRDALRIVGGGQPPQRELPPETIDQPRAAIRQSTHEHHASRDHAPRRRGFLRGRGRRRHDLGRRQRLSGRFGRRSRLPQQVGERECQHQQRRRPAGDRQRRASS